MGLVNYYAQKAYIDDVQGDLERMNSYGSFLMQYKSLLDEAWAGNIDKQAVMNALDHHLKAVNQVRQDMNWFKVTARFTLDRINELGSLQGAPAPYIPGIGLIGGLISAISVNRIRIDTGKIRNITQLLQGKRGLLEDSRNRMYRATNIIDSVILWLFGINGRLVSIQRQLDSLISENTRIVNAIGRICEIYDETDRNLRNKGDSVHITGLIDGAGTAPGLKSLLERLAVVCPMLKPFLDRIISQIKDTPVDRTAGGTVKEKSPNEIAFEDTPDETAAPGQDIAYHEAAINGAILTKLDSIKANRLNTTFESSGYRGAKQCFGFAGWVFHELFGVDMPNQYYDARRYELVLNDNVELLGTLTNYPSADSLRNLFVSARPGDVIQLDAHNKSQHTMIFEGITPDGKVKVLHANFDGKNGISEDELTFDYLAQRSTEGISLYHAKNYDSVFPQ